MVNSIKSTGKFVLLHSSLLFRLYVLDLLFFAMTVWYIVFDITVDDPFRPIIFLVMFSMFFIALHLKIVNEQCGSINYYKNLPFRTILPVFVSHVLVFLPLTCTFLITGIIVNTFGFQTDKHLLILRIAHLLTIFYSIKIITLPVMFLINRHPAVLGGFFFLLIPIVIMVLMFDEFFWSHLPHRELWGMLQFVISLFLIELISISRLEIRQIS